MAAASAPTLLHGTLRVLVQEARDVPGERVGLIETMCCGARPARAISWLSGSLMPS